MYYEVYVARIYRIACQANWPVGGRGCCGCGPRAESPSEAVALAEEVGWQVINDRWICPAHQEAANEHA